MFLINWLHAILNHILFYLKLVPSRQVGWKSLNRKTGQLEREREPLWKKVKLILLFNPLTEWIDTTHAMRLWIHCKNVQEGKDEGTPASHNKIKSFIDFYNINIDEFEPSDPEKYGTFKDFFVRKHKEGSRPIHKKNDPKAAVVVADSRVVTYDTVPQAKKLWIKGSEFNLTNLVMDVNLGASFEDGSVASFRLSPQDYHRYHSPVSGTIKEFRSLPGSYYQVDPIALRSKVNILTSNARDYVVIDSPEFGKVLFVAIGATNVGTVYFHEKCRTVGTKIDKGEEIGIFQFGGSSVIVAFQKGRIKFDDDLRDCSNAVIQVSVEVGMSLGEATKPSANGGNESSGGYAFGQGKNEKSFAEAVKEGDS
ncbi:putative phosphatidylserine decarboxylase [Bimuria novae-zelandiae CBS 107.79]|uniref:phosphatidylserine decarboxylase n=1 Tax=Bimuria novae-zelandiae CBS 107.79 TaxID=1447943 RepID=A0A6A5UG89_9PLEO|nr:putative phosphatidylserine decarboxylase [Bimuria novae-zelandiae CBS 107.79]